MGRVFRRVEIQVAALVLALVWGVMALQLGQRAHVSVCPEWYSGGTTLGRTHPGSPGCYFLDRVMEWRAGPTAAMAVAILFTVAFGLFAVSPRRRGAGRS